MPYSVPNRTRVASEVPVCLNGLKSKAVGAPVSVEEEGPESGPQGIGAGPDPVALTMALGGANREDAKAFLEKQGQLADRQSHLADLQAKELSHEIKLRHWSLQLRHGSAILKFALEVSITLVAIFLACLTGAAVWNATQDDGLVIEAFSVPPNLASRGLTGQVVATQMLDNLSALQAQSTSIRAPSSFANNWGDNLKVEIPETGVSVGEFNRYLHQVLGHQTHISGEVIRSETGIEITTRVGSDISQTFSGPDTEFHSLLKQAAESVYAHTQPYRYTSILGQQGKFAELEQFARAHTQTGPTTERAWAFYSLTQVLAFRGRADDAYNAAQKSVALNPNFAFGWYRVGVNATNLGRDEEALSAAQTALRLLKTASKDLLPDTALTIQRASNFLTAKVLGDYAEYARLQVLLFPAIDLSADPATQVQQAQSAVGGGVGTPIGVHGGLARIKLSMHDSAEARRFLAEEPAYIAAMKNNTVIKSSVRGQADIDGAAQVFRSLERSLAFASEDWPRFIQLAQIRDAQEASLAAAYFSARNTVGDGTIITGMWPYAAYAKARIGNFAAAHGQIDRTPAYCDLCLRMRGKIDALQRNYGSATFWFADAISKAPSIPFAYTDWGEMLLTNGKPDEAIEKFKLANQKGPHFADPLEMWGEVLMTKNQSHKALEKFAEADKCAPNWGRLHLKWGEALVYAGKKDEAKKQFARAAQLDLTPPETAELANVNHNTEENAHEK